ncbi:MAG: signal recognition particle-docking protein FtsY, partial [Gemmatimonadota bacterium]
PNRGTVRSLWQKIVDVSLTDVTTLVRGIDETSIEALEQVLLEADFGVDVTMELVEDLERASRRGSVKTESDLRELLAGRIRAVFAEAGEAPDPSPSPALESERGPHVILLLGVNGTGKTTTAAKLVRRATEQGRSVVLAATDTFRSGAQEQLKAWAERLGAGFVGGEKGADPAAVAFDAASAAVSRQADVLIVDTAGRLHTERGLMEELRKIDRVVGRIVPGAPQERLLVVDATAGQNVIQQARDFGDALPLTGIVLSKFDSSARGGTAVAVARDFHVPVTWLGTGERAEDLEPFDADVYVEKLLG